MTQDCKDGHSVYFQRLYSHLIVEQLVRHKAAAIRDVKMSVINPREAFVCVFAHCAVYGVPVAGEDAALGQHLVQVSPALGAQAQGRPQPQPEGGAAGVSCELGPGHKSQMSAEDRGEEPTRRQDRSGWSAGTPGLVCAGWSGHQ